MNRGRLVVFEGVDGSGKSTQLGLLAEQLRESHLAPIVTKEPTDGRWGRKIRAMARSGEVIAPEEELRWFLEDRREHVEKVMRPGIEAGRIVLSDRYYLSTVAYQGARGFDPQALLAQAEAEFPMPDLALIFELDPEAGLARVQARGDAAEPTFEEAGFLARVAAVFRALDRPYLARIDASRPIEAVARAVRETVRERLAI
ncbi:MAG: thymidylate kinase [Deltaproteobacteria bacterium]|nr:thymidylate kinase [Deltaproteobacteria bacterium]